MPLVRISLREGTSVVYRHAIAFQVITEHDPAHLNYDAHYMGIERSEDLVFIQMTLVQRRTAEATH